MNQYKTFILIWQVSNVGGNQIVNGFFSHRISWKKYGSDLQTYKHKVAENLGLQISGISRQQTLSMLVSIGAQHSHLHQVLLPILPSTSFLATLVVENGATQDTF